MDLITLKRPYKIGFLLGELWIKTFAFTYRNWIFTKRNIFALVEIIFWPLVGIFSVGLLGNFLEIKENIRAFILSGAIAVGVLQVCQLDVSYCLLYDVWSKSVKHTFLAPIRILYLILGSWMAGMVRGSLVFLILMFVSTRVFAFSLPRFNFTLIFIVGLFLNGLLIGTTVCSLMLIFGQHAEFTAWTLSTLFMLLCGIYYPPHLLPQPLYFIAQAFPLTYFLAYFRSFYGFPLNWGNVLLRGFLLLALYGLGSWILSSAALNRAKARGIILRLSE